MFPPKAPRLHMAQTMAKATTGNIRFLKRTTERMKDRLSWPSSDFNKIRFDPSELCPKTIPAMPTSRHAVLNTAKHESREKKRS